MTTLYRIMILKRMKKKKPRMNIQNDNKFLPLSFFQVCFECWSIVSLGLTTRADVEDEDDDIPERSISCLSSSKALLSTSWISMYLFLFESLISGVSFPVYVSRDTSSPSMILFSTSEQRGKNRFPISTVHKYKRTSESMKLNVKISWLICERLILTRSA